MALVLPLSLPDELDRCPSTSLSLFVVEPARTTALAITCVPSLYGSLLVLCLDDTGFFLDPKFLRTAYLLFHCRHGSHPLWLLYFKCHDVFHQVTGKFGGLFRCQLMCFCLLALVDSHHCHLLNELPNSLTCQNLE